MQADRSGVRRQLSALGQRSSLSSADRVPASLLGPTGCLAGCLADATSLLNGLVSQVPKALQGLVLGLIVLAHSALPFWTSWSIDSPDTSSMAGRSPGDNLPVVTPLRRRLRAAAFARACRVRHARGSGVQVPSAPP